MNRLQELWNYNQSFWYDYIRRSLLTSGELKKLVEQDGLRGMTSNPTIFEKAISSGSEYDTDIKKLGTKDLSTYELFEALALQDIQGAADIFKPVFNSSKGTDGFVSMEVSPELANETQATVAQAKDLFKKIKRPNIMIKIPGTPAGIPAIEQCLTEGVNINITLLFSVENYKQVLEAYLKALEKRVKAKKPIQHLASVASFFVSRVDVSIDKLLDQKIANNEPTAEKAKLLLHKAAIANAKLAYAHYEMVMASDRWRKLKAKGAQPQRLLWASTGAKDKRISDVLYIDALIGPDTVNTMPPQTSEAFKDHGTLALTIRDGVTQAQSDIAALGKMGIDIEAICAKLQSDGVKSFIASFDALLQVVGAKREMLTRRWSNTLKFELGSYQEDYQSSLQFADGWTKRIWEKDAALWKSEEDHQKIIRNSLGWLTVPSVVRQNLSKLNAIVADVKKAKFTRILLLGMGGSSLCPEVLRLTFGKKGADFAILDSTEPASVAERAAWAKPAEKTLFIVASKSGSTIEPNAFLSYFFDLVEKKKGKNAGENFIAITDPGTQMEKLAQYKKFRHIVLNPADIGGRYSALSFFGMLPAALLGIDVAGLLDDASSLSYACSPLVPSAKNPGVMLGTALGSLANKGRNKVTYFLSKDISSFSTWVEQLIAESTGKEGKGILPVESEPIGHASDYGNDRVFVSIQTKANPGLEKKLKDLKKAGHPIIQIQLKNKLEMGAQIFLWEFATAMAGALMQIDPFDQPNVQESKDLTKKYLEEFVSKGTLAQGFPLFRENGVAVYAPTGAAKGNSVETALKSLLDQIQPGDYVAVLAYLTRNQQTEAVLQVIRQQIMKAKKVATTLGFGPRFLHSTGQLHKGGANNGVFLQITADDKQDLPIPGEPYTYKTLKEAQALGDLSALASRNRRVVRIHMKDAAKELPKLKDLFKKLTEN